MPDFSTADRETYTSVSIQLRDFRGWSKSANIPRAKEAVSGAEAEALRTAVGNISNARVMSETVTAVDAIINDADPANTVFDEAYSHVEDAIILLFQDNTGRTTRFRVPAPDLSIFQADGETVDIENALFTALRDAVLAVLPAGYIFKRTWLEGLGKRARTPLPVAEPAELENPPQLPASEGI